MGDNLGHLALIRRVLIALRALIEGHHLAVRAGDEGFGFVVEDAFRRHFAEALPHIRYIALQLAVNVRDGGLQGVVTVRYHLLAVGGQVAQSIGRAAHLAVSAVYLFKFKDAVHAEIQHRGRDRRRVLKELHRLVEEVIGQHVFLIVIDADVLSGGVLNVQLHAVLLRQALGLHGVSVELGELIAVRQLKDLIQKVVAVPEGAAFACIRHFVAAPDRAARQLCRKLVDMVPQRPRFGVVHGGEPAVDGDYLLGLNGFRRVGVAVIHRVAIAGIGSVRLRIGAGGDMPHGAAGQQRCRQRQQPKYGRHAFHLASSCILLSISVFLSSFQRFRIPRVSKTKFSQESVSACR